MSPRLPTSRTGSPGARPRQARGAGRRAAPVRLDPAEPAGVVAALVADARASCAERSWIPRAPVLALVAWWAVRHVADAEYSSVIGPLNFGVHELGHVVFAFLGAFLGIAGGTLLQCAAPLVAGVMFVRQRDYFAVSFALAWLATNLYDVAVYAADARSQSLHLVGLGSGEPIHDWGYLLGRLGLLGSDHALAAMLRGCGALAFAVSLALGGWLLVTMARGGRTTSSPGA